MRAEKTPCHQRHAEYGGDEIIRQCDGHAAKPDRQRDPQHAPPPQTTREIAHDRRTGRPNQVESEDKADAVTQKVVGNDETQMKGYNDRLAIREIIGDRLAREVILEPKSR